MPDKDQQLQSSLGYEFSESAYLEQALRHRSTGPRNNERLEFLGDSILNFCITEKLYALKPESPEGDLSRIRASLVNSNALAVIAEQLNLSHYIQLGQGEKRSGGKRRKSIQADAVEAILGAVLLDGGFEVCRELILRLYQPYLKNLPDAESLKDPKTQLQEFLQGRGRGLPKYEVVAEIGKDHEKQFEVICQVQDIEGVTALGSSRRKAEQMAAQKMLNRLSG